MDPKYSRFGWMICASTLLMYGLTYLNSASAADVFFSETRVFMALMMGAMMCAVMLLFMRSMYPDRRKNRFILAGAAAVFVASLVLVRSQATIGDEAWMKGMIPHHSIAILTSERAHLSDPRVRALAQRISETQKREITEMEGLLRELRR